jgi:polysaccharide pyruvyl transferase WcaK-like protein
LSAVTVLSVAQSVHSMKSAKFSCLIFGGGPIMTTPPVVEVSLLFDIANKMKIQTVLAGCGVGPFSERQLMPYLVNIIAKANTRIFRDNESLVRAQDLTEIRKSDAVTNDPSFTWLASNETIALDNSSSDKRKVLVLGLRDIPFKEYAHELDSVTAKRIKYNFEVKLIDGLIAVCEQIPDLRIIPVPMCTNHFGSDDRWSYRGLFRGHEKLMSNIDMQFLYNELAPSAYLRAFQLSDACLTMRFHALAFGLATNKRCVVLDYTFGKGKVKALADKYQQPTVSISDVESAWIVKHLLSALISPTEGSRELIDDTFSKELLESMSTISDA